MCGRFFVDAKNREIDRLLELLPAEDQPVKTGEIFPTNYALVLANENGKPVSRSMQWGFPRKDSKNVIINARAETALTKPFFAHSLRKRPLAIPTNGFFEWKSAPDKKLKEKFLFGASPDILWLAGFWNFFPEEGKRFTILTTAANESIKGWHDRMPLLLKEDEVNDWLMGVKLMPILQEKPFSLPPPLLVN